MEVLSEEPGVILFHNFITGEECRQLRDKGRGRMKVNRYLQIHFELCVICRI